MEADGGMQRVYLQYIINRCLKLLKAPEYTACAWFFITLLESLLHSFRLPEPPSMPDDFLTLLQGAQRGALASDSLCTTTRTTSMARRQAVGNAHRGGNLLACVRVAVLALPKGHLQKNHEFF